VDIVLREALLSTENLRNRSKSANSILASNDIKDGEKGEAMKEVEATRKALVAFDGYVIDSTDQSRGYIG